MQTLRLDREDPNKVVARIHIDAQTPVRTDSVAQLNFMGITGVTFIQILAGDRRAPSSVNAARRRRSSPAAATRCSMSCSRRTGSRQ